MDVFIICLICTALMFGVEYFGRRHMRLFKLKAESQGGENIVSAVDQVYYGGKESDKSEAERLRTRKIKYVLWALIVFFGAASIVFVNFKDQWLGEWKSFFSSENKVEVKAPITKADDYSLSVWDYLAAQFSYEKALEYYGAKRIAEVRDAEAEYKKCEEALKQAQKESDSVKMLSCRTRLNEAEAGLLEARADLATYDKFMHDWKLYLKLNWLILILLLVGVLDLYIELKGDEGVWEGCGVVLSFLAAVAGVAWPAILVLNVYQCGMIFTFKDVIGIILTLWCFCFLMRHISFED